MRKILKLTAAVMAVLQILTITLSVLADEVEETSQKAAVILENGKFLTFNLTAALIFTYICIASICSYTLWYYVLKNNSLSKMFIIKFSEPLFACLFGALILNENILKWQYLIAFLLISFGIILGNKSDNKSAVK